MRPRTESHIILRTFVHGDGSSRTINSWLLQATSREFHNIYFLLYFANVQQIMKTSGVPAEKVRYLVLRLSCELCKEKIAEMFQKKKLTVYQSTQIVTISELKTWQETQKAVL